MKIAAGSGISVIVVIVLGSVVIRSVNGGEAKIYFDTMISTSRYLCSAIMTATATVLAVMTFLTAST